MNLRPPGPKPGRLPTDIYPHIKCFLAGALGLEPRVPVLETGGLPINRYPYGVSSKNRTYITKATIWCSAIELYQPYWRREWDSNPRDLRPPVFKTGAINQTRPSLHIIYGVPSEIRTQAPTIKSRVLYLLS